MRKLAPVLELKPVLARILAQKTKTKKISVRGFSTGFSLKPVLNTDRDPPQVRRKEKI